MFRLDKLDLRGFKSFVDPASLDFSGGMTGIVGPNGCGKSNVCDAVCWVLGERSAKSLRGEKMEDIIFAGSEGRKPVGMAEVELTLTTEATFEAAEDGKLTIARRVHRSGESQYILNGKTVRLKDIKDLLMDTGLGIRAYSVIEQGKIGMILSGKPHERRRLLEEAAGITRYKERRRIAELKLEEARDNLSRLDDIVSELEKRLRSLKRQAGAARRFKERKDKYQDLFKGVLLGRWGRLWADRTELQSSIDSTVEREAAEEAELQISEADLAKQREKLDVLSRELADEHRREADLAARIEGKQEFLKGSRQRLQELADRITAGIALAENRQKRLAELKASLAGMGEDSQSLASERDTAASEVTEDERKIGEVESLVAEAGGRLEALRGRLLQSIGELNGMRNRLHREQMEREKGDLRQKHLADELAQKLHDAQETARELEEATSRHGQLAKQVRAREEALSAAEREVADFKRRLTEVEEKRASSTEERGGLKHRRQLLVELSEAQAERRAKIERVLAEAGLEQPAFLADHIDVPEGWERSLDLYLGQIADALVLKPGQDALELAGRLAGAGAGARIVESDLGGLPDPRHPEDPAILSSLADALKLPGELGDALPRAYLVETRDDARRLARRYRGVAFISRERLWAQAGTLHVESEQASPGALAREHELADIGRRLPELETEIANLTLQREELTEKIQETSTRRDTIRTELADLSRKLAVADARRTDLEGRERRFSVEHHTLDTERIEIERNLGMVSERAEQFAAELERNETLHKELEADFDKAQAEVDSARSQRESARTSGASRRGRLELLQQKLDAHHRERARLEREIQEGHAFLESWETEKAGLERRGEEIQEALHKAEGELQTTLEHRAEAQEHVLGRQAKLDAKREVLAEVESKIEARRSDRDVIRAELGELRVTEATLDNEISHLNELYTEEFDEGLPETPEPASDDLDEREADLARLKDQIDRSGPVNLLAAEEFAEQEERHGFLAEQREDVANSVDSLRKTISEIDETSSERFLTTFREVNEGFGRTYSELFRGGQAEMRLLDEDDPLESGIEIVARPPGKRLQNIMLLSGGEKALTATALLFALFKTKPSPFCILDEVDAPLDDVNTLRFVEMVKQMSHETQFIVITHNKLTMEAASRLYGVTMQERGVSQLVSVELDDLHPDELAATA